MSLKDRLSKRAQSHENGYVSFSADDMKKAATHRVSNTEAYELLAAAMTTSSHITEIDKHNNNIDIDDVYPCTAAECDEMEQLVNQAEQAVADPNDEDFKDAVIELRSIIDWSRKKHWTFKWSLIAGCVLSIFIMMYISEDATRDKQKAQSQYNKVDNWAEADTTIAFDQCADIYYSTSSKTLTSHNLYKAQTLSTKKNAILLAEKNVAYYQNSLDTAQTRDAIKEYKKKLKAAEKEAEKLHEEYDEINEMSFKKFKKYALEEVGAELSAAKSWARRMWFFYIYVILLIPLYIYCSHQYGYNITRHRAERAALDKLQKWSFAIASFFLGTSFALEFFPTIEVTTHYSNGSKTKHTESNPMDIAIMALKVILLIAAAIVFCVVSVFIMTYVTVMAFKRDHDWSKVAAATKTIASKGIDVASKAAEKAAEQLKNKNEQPKN